MTSQAAKGHNAGDPGSVKSWLVSAGRDRRPGSPLNLPPYPASNFVLREHRAYSRDDGPPGWRRWSDRRRPRRRLFGLLRLGDGGDRCDFRSTPCRIDRGSAGRLLSGCRGTRQRGSTPRPVNRASARRGRHRRLDQDVQRGRLDLAGVAFQSAADGS